MAKKRIVNNFIVEDTRKDFKFKLISGKVVGTRAETKEEAARHIASCLELAEGELQDAA